MDIPKSRPNGSTHSWEPTKLRRTKHRSGSGEGERRKTDGDSSIPKKHSFSPTRKLGSDGDTRRNRRSSPHRNHHAGQRVTSLSVVSFRASSKVESRPRPPRRESPPSSHNRKPPHPTRRQSPPPLRRRPPTFERRQTPPQSRRKSPPPSRRQSSPPSRRHTARRHTPPPSSRRQTSPPSRRQSSPPSRRQPSPPSRRQSSPSSRRKTSPPPPSRRSPPPRRQQSPQRSTETKRRFSKGVPASRSNISLAKRSRSAPSKCSPSQQPGGRKRPRVRPSIMSPHESCNSKKSRLSVEGSSSLVEMGSGGGGGASTTSGMASSAKLSLSELNNGCLDAVDFDELNLVDKWVRSAPDELYYSRNVDGDTVATERTKVLCSKFEETLLVKLKQAREEAEVQGVQKMAELIHIENVELAQERALRKKQKGKKSKCCAEKHNHKQIANEDHQAAVPSPLESSNSSTFSSATSSSVNKERGAKSKEESDSVASSGKEIGIIESAPPSREKLMTERVPEEAIPNAINTKDKAVIVTLTKTGRDEDSMEEGELADDDDSKELQVEPVEKQGETDECQEEKQAKATTSTVSESSGKDESSGKNDTGKKKKLIKKKGPRENLADSSSDFDTENSDSSSDEDSSDCGFGMTRSDTANRELERRKKHPCRLHQELWHNDPGLMNDGPVCRCSAKARRYGIRHGFYPGEQKIPLCDMFTNNQSRLYHYRITISPPKNFLISTPTVINHDGHEYIFEGFSIFSHYKLDLTLPACKVIRFNIRYDVFVQEERFPESFCVQELFHFESFLFREILELVDLKYDWNEETGCSQFHLMPRFVRQLPDNGQEILSMSRVLIHLLKSDRELVKEDELHQLYTVEQGDWQNFADRHKGTIVAKWGMKPCAIRVDQIDRDVTGQDHVEEDGIPFPLIVHFGIRPPQLSYAGNADYQRAWRRYVKYRHLLSNMPKPSAEDKMKLFKKEAKLQAMRTAANLKRDVTVAISSKGFRTTGICCDLVQHAMLIPVLVAHLRFHKCLETLEGCMKYPFGQRYYLQLAMTHPSYRENFGTNPDHARNALTNCGIRQPEYGDRRIHYASTRKRGINTLINIMSKFGNEKETESDITHNERLEFLGDAVVEFVTSIHLFHIFPDLEEGGLATYRAAIVQNQHLAVLAQTLNLDQYMLYAHGSDLCHDSELRHAMANCFEALMGALLLDGGIEAADRVFGHTLFGHSASLLDLWANYPKHPLQKEEPTGDREWIKSHSVLQKLTEFEGSIGVEFNHIRLLARAFTDRSLGYNNLTRGSNQRLEFLGDTVLQLISSEHLYRFFPDHHEGHLSLLRSSLVNNRTQSVVCDDLDMPQYAMRGDPKSEMKTKDRADLLEAFLGALYIDKGLVHCTTFCRVCFFPRLSNSITKQEWNDPKSKLQQCCLTLRAMNGKEPDIPTYKVTECLGPTNTRTYIVAVYFRGRRLAAARGHSIQEAEMNAAGLALEVSGHLFPQLNHQKRIMDKTKKTTIEMIGFCKALVLAAKDKKKRKNKCRRKESYLAWSLKLLSNNNEEGWILLPSFTLSRKRTSAGV